MQEKILKFILGKREVRTSDLIKALGVSRPTIIKYLKLLESRGEISHFENGPKTFYTSLDENKQSSRNGLSFSKIYKRAGLREDDVFSEVKFRFLKNLRLTEGLEHILAYAFTEMLNNAIDHSKSNRIQIALWVEDKNVYFSVQDFGIGIFANLKEKLRLKSELEGAQEMTKGKITTEPSNHTGQGVFFTSRVADAFTIQSHELKYSVENKKDNFVILRLKKNVRGTEVVFKIAKNAKIHMTDIFRKYEDTDWNFSKTEIKVRLYAKYTHLVSRSQAKMILAELDKFSKIIFDFKDVNQVGQGFADEIFRVFKNHHPGIHLSTENMNENVAFMVTRAQKSVK